MEKRREQLRDLKTYIKGIDDEVSMILQTLQWDKKHLLQSTALVTCKYFANHKIPPDKTEEHEKECFLRQNGYSKEDQLLPDPLNLESNTLVKLGKEDIEKIIAKASRSDELFKKGVGCRDAEPLSLERLQSTYSGDERRAIHDAVVSAVPSCHDLTDLALLSGGYDTSSKVVLSRQEILLQLRNMRRRPAKYRVAAKSRNYSDVLRDVIKTQMEHYSDAKTESTPKETVEKDTNQKDTHNDRRYSTSASKDDRHKYDGKVVPEPIKIKKEREDPTERNYRDYNRGRSNKPYRYEMGGRDGRDRDYDRRQRNDRSRERRHYHDQEKSGKYGEHSRKKRHDDESKERRNFYEETEVRRKVNDPVEEHSSEKRSRKRHKDYDSDYKERDPVDNETSNHRRDRDKKRDKAHTHKGKKDRRRDRERSKERRSDYRYEEKSSQGIHIKEEREDSDTRDETEYRSHKSKKRRRDRSNGDDRNHDHRSVEIKQEKYERYYDMLSEEMYDPNKKIKEEK